MTSKNRLFIGAFSTAEKIFQAGLNNSTHLQASKFGKPVDFSVRKKLGMIEEPLAYLGTFADLSDP